METPYRPENVRVEYHPEGSNYGPRFQYLTVDCDGTPMQWFTNPGEAEAARKDRARVIKAALTRRANKRTG